MDVYPIVLENGITWNLFSESLSLEQGRYVARILFETREVFTEIFGTTTVNAHPVLGVVPTNGDPQTERPNSIIFISQMTSMYIPYIYQFAHELCHFMVPSEVCKSYRWFEETLCQMMSWYALKVLYCSRSKGTTHLYPGLYADVPSYIKRSQSDQPPIGDMSLSEFIRFHLPHLQAECYDRPMNRAIAYAIYPLFLETPELWKIVLSLHTLTDDMLLDEGIKSLLGTVDVEEYFRDQLVKRLTE